MDHFLELRVCKCRPHKSRVCMCVCVCQCVCVCVLAWCRRLGRVKYGG